MSEEQDPKKPVLQPVQYGRDSVLYSGRIPVGDEMHPGRTPRARLGRARERAPRFMKSVREVMSQDIITIHPSSSVKSAIILMQGHEVGVLPVVTDEALLGIVETHDLLGRDPDQRISEVMCGVSEHLPNTDRRR